MLRARHTGAVLGVVFVLGISGCVTLPPNSKRSPQDPWESWNRGVYKVNDKLDRAVLKPVAKTYVRAVPAPARTGISNVLSNLKMTTVMINDGLQGKFRAAAVDLARFALNLTVGFGGLLDPATQAGLARNDEEFGQTLGVWGVPPGPFFEIPFLGPSDVRDGPARIVDFFTGPLHYTRNADVGWGIFGMGLVDLRADLLSLDNTLNTVYDPYAFVRDAYLQRRAYLISDGKITDEPPLEDPGTDDSPPAAAPTPAGAPPPSTPPTAPPTTPPSKPE
jgi:phospholipid-binding lipoprotein MlaA